MEEASSISVRDFIYIAGFLLTILSIFFSRKDKSENKIELAIKDLKEEIKKDIDLLFEKLAEKVDDKLCKERMDNHKDDIDGLGELVRRG